MIGKPAIFGLPLFRVPGVLTGNSEGEVTPQALQCDTDYIAQMEMATQTSCPFRIEWLKIVM